MPSKTPPSICSASGGGSSKKFGTSSRFANWVGLVPQKPFDVLGNETGCCTAGSRPTSQLKARSLHQLSRFDARIFWLGLSSKLFSRFSADIQRLNASSAVAGSRSALERVDPNQNSVPRDARISTTTA